MSDNTQDFSKFGYREHDMAGDLLKAYASGKWASKDDEMSDGVKVEFNPNSGNVFLIDDDLNVAMMNDDDKLENFLNCAYCVNEGFRSEITLDDRGYCEDCKDKK